MKKAMISQPMRGETIEEVEKIRIKAQKKLEKEGYEVIDTYFKEFENWNFKDEGVKNKPVWFFARALAAMSQCDKVYMCKGWENARGCRIEKMVAEEYGLEVEEE